MAILTETVIAAAAAAIAAGISGWMFIDSLGVKGLPGCGAASGCGAVTKSRWSRLGPAPVSGVGAVVYLLMLVLTVAIDARAPRSAQETAAFILTPLALVVIGTGVWFVTLQGLVIRRFCPYCMLIQFCGITAACVVLTQIAGRHGQQAQIQIAIAAIGLALLIGGQILIKPKTYAVIASSEPLVGEPTEDIALEQPRISSSPRPLTNRKVRLRSGRVVINIDDFPVIGPLDAEHVIAWLFDYTCEECHHLHRLLLKAVEQYAGRLAVLAIPVPLNPACNPSVKCHSQERAYSCAYARLDWAMWMVDVGLHAAWDRFMAEEQEVKPFGLALLKAKELADISRFEFRESDPELDSRIAAGIEIHRVAGEPKIPALLLPGGLMLGHIPTLEVMIELLDEHLKQKASTGNLTSASP